MIKKLAIERWELKVKNKQNIFGDWQLDIIKVKSDPTFFSGDLQLVIETEKPKKVNHQSPITNHQSPITNHQSPEIWELAENQGVNCYLGGAYLNTEKFAPPKTENKEKPPFV